jgi:integrase
MRPGYHCDGGGLYLQISPAHTRSWIFRYARSGKGREMGLGPLRDVSLAQARAKASECRHMLVDGIDPIDARDAKLARESLSKARAITFSSCAAKYIEANKAAWGNAKHALQWQSTLDTYAGPVIGHLAVQDVDTALVLRVLEPIWTKKPETATRLRGRIERILDWARVMGYRAGENPARWRGHLDKLLPAALNRKGRKHHAALPYDEIGKFIQRLRAEQGTAARALEFAILTGARTSEVIGARLDEFSFAKDLWVVPAERMKAGREHRVPLSPRAVEIATGQPARKYLFTGREEGKPMSNMAMLELLRRMGRSDLTVHGFRSTLRDWAAECSAYPREVCEMALAHAISDKVEAAYRRGDLFEKRRSMMLDWAKYCDVPERTATPLALSRRAA